MKVEFYSYWIFYVILFYFDFYYGIMPVWASYSIITAQWISFIFLGGVFGFYKYLEIQYKDVYLEGLLVAFISRSFLQIISIFGYQDKRFVIAITGFCILMWVAIMANRKIKSKINSIERTLF